MNPKKSNSGFLVVLLILVIGAYYFISKNGTLSDTLSTTLFVMGKDKAIDYWRAHSDEFDMILLTDDEQLYVSEGIKDSFTSDRDVNIVEKDD